MTASAAPTIQYIPAERPKAPVAGPSLSELCAAARALINSIHVGGQRYGPNIESGFEDLEKLVDTIERKFIVGRMASYLVDEALATCKRVRDLGAQERSRAGDEARTAKSGIAALGIVRPVADIAEGLIDRECRDVVRAMTAAKRNEMLEEMRKGQHIRVMLASARHPMPADFDVEAARLYGKFSEPAKRTNFLAMVVVYEAKQVAAQALLEAANATRAIVTRFVELEAARDDETEVDRARQFSATLTRPETSSFVSQVAAPTQWPRATVQIEGSAITRIG